MSERYDFSLARLIFFGVPPPSSTSGGGRLCQGGKEKFVTRLAFRRARGQRRNKQAQTSLKAYRVEFLEPLTEYPGTDNKREGTSKCFGHALNSLDTCTHQKTAAFNWYLTATAFGNHTRCERENSHVRQ
jgi:hypothetical protein